MTSWLKWLLAQMKALFQLFMVDPPIASTSLQACMEDPPVTASLGPIDRLICQLRSLEGSGHTLPLGISVNQIGKLRENLEKFHKPLKVLAEAEETSYRAKWWMKEVRELCYDSEDYLVQYGAGDPCRGPRWIGALLGRIMFWSKLKFMGRVEVLVGIGERSINDEIEAAMSLKKENKAHISSEKENKLDIGLLTTKLVNLLAFDQQTRLKLVPIHGSLGAGKTALARTLYVQYKRRFQCWAFVRVPRNPDIRSVLTSILTQTKAPPPHVFPGVQDIIVTISRHLERKRYFIVIDDVWSTSVWDIISRAFPVNNCGSRIILTTQGDDVASACSGYEMESTPFKMDALNGCTDTTTEAKSKVLNFTYSNLPLHLKTCLLYLGMYLEGCTITKDDLAKKWVAEGFIAAVTPDKLSEVPRDKTEDISDVPQDKTEEISQVPRDKIEEILEVPQDKTEIISEVPRDKREEFAEVIQKEKEEIARGYFDELVTRGMIQPVDRNGRGEVLSCIVHQMVLDLIRYRSKEDNFIVALDNLQSTFRHPDMVRRLSLQFGCQKCATMPVNIMLSQVRSLAFFGFFKCVPMIANYGLLQVLNLHIWADENKIFDLSCIGKLYQLRYLKIECNITVRLPLEIRRLHHLGTLELHAEVVAIPSDIGHLEKLVHVCCPSNDDLMRDLSELTNLLDLQLTWSTLENLEHNMECLCSILVKLSSLRCLALVPASGSCSVPVNPSRLCISCDSLLIVSPASENLQRLEFSRRCCMFSRLPKWIGKLGKLCILKIAVGNLLTEDIDVLKGMPSLTSLSLHVQTRAATMIVFGKGGFSVLTYFKLTCSVPRLEFETGAMPDLEKLKLCFNSTIVDEQGTERIIIIGRLLGLKVISAVIGSAGVDAESAWRKTIKSNLGNPEVRLMGWIYSGDQGREMKSREGSGEDENNETDIRVPTKQESSHLPVPAGCREEEQEEISNIPSESESTDGHTGQVFVIFIQLGIRRFLHRNLAAIGAILRRKGPEAKARLTNIFQKTVFHCLINLYRAAYNTKPCTAAAAIPSTIDKTVVCHFHGGLLRSTTLFPYFMLVAFEGGSLLRALLLLCSFPLVWVLGELSSAGVRVMAFVTFAGLRPRDANLVAHAILPKFYMESLNAQVYENLWLPARRKVVVTSAPRVMAEWFLKHYMAADVVIGCELQTFKVGRRCYFTGLLCRPAPVAPALTVAQVAVVGSSNQRDHFFVPYCKEVYTVSKESAKTARLPRARYPKPLIFHDGRLAFLPTATATLAFFLFLPLGLVLSVIRISIGILLPYNISFAAGAFFGVRFRTSGLPMDGTRRSGVLYVCTHRTLVDPIMLTAALQKPVPAVTYSPSLLSEILSPIKTVRLTRHRERDAEMMSRLLEQGDLAVCPEDTTCREPYLLRFSPLFAELADDMEPVALDAQVTSLYGTTASGRKWLNPVAFFANPVPAYRVEFLGAVPQDQTRKGGRTGAEVANWIQQRLAEALGFECTGLTRRDKYNMLIGKDDVVRK